MADSPVSELGTDRCDGCIFDAGIPADASACPSFASHATAHTDHRQRMSVALLACRCESHQPIYATEQRVFALLPNLAKPLDQIAGGLVGDAQIPVQLHARQGAGEGGERMHRQCPGAVGEIGILHDRPRAHAEPLVTAAAAVGHGLVVRALLDAHGAAMWAGFLSLPSLFRKPVFGGGVVGE